jgi:hypothetical protein
MRDSAQLVGASYELDMNLDVISLIRGFFKFLHIKNSNSCIDTPKNANTYTNGFSNVFIFYLVKLFVNAINAIDIITNTNVFIDIS